MFRSNSSQAFAQKIVNKLSGLGSETAQQAVANLKLDFPEIHFSAAEPRQHGAGGQDHRQGAK